MLSFAVFDSTGPASDWATAESHVFGQDEVPVPAEVRAVPGRIVCEKHSAEAAGLATVFPPLEEHDGSPLYLQTCLLPERDHPYLLSLELARQRIMTLLNKLEDWSLFDLSSDHPAMLALEEARLAFTKALVSHRLNQGSDGSYAKDADKMAREAIDLALKASDALVAAQSERALPDRVSGAAYANAIGKDPAKGPYQGPAVKSPNDTGLVLPIKPAISVGLNPVQFSESLQNLITTGCDFISLPTRWRDMEPDEGKYAFTPTDRWIEWAVRHSKMPVSAGPVVDLSRSNVPDWLYIWEHDYETLREVVYEHVKNVITRYRRTVPRWTVLSGLNRNDNFQLSFEQMMDLTRMAMLLARKLHPQGKMQIEVLHPFSAEPGHRPRSLPGALYAEMVQQAGIGVDAWGVRLELDRPKPGCIRRDLMSLSAAIDRYALLDRPLAITAVSRALEPGAGVLDEEDITWLRRAMEVIVSKPSVMSFVWQEQELPPGAKGPMPGSLIDTSGQPRPAVKNAIALRKAIQSGDAIATMPKAVHA
ncbi:MAG: endo-1,4-beta-xylanase [Phycisphaerales bacterium]|nr:endo-1,4-beta-xylanase [Phycisphaerales bacterium]MCB9835429.1 endo-1,4-beta-xylanase [Phycisphaera sp.]